jgi:hypothetical protein
MRAVQRRSGSERRMRMITVEKPSNADKVRAMDDLTLADFMYRIAYCGCSREDMYEWLKLESDDSWQKELMRFREELNK